MKHKKKKKKKKKNQTKNKVQNKFVIAFQTEGPSVVINKKKAVAPDNKLHFATGSAKRTAQSEEQGGDTKATMFQFDSSKEIQVQNDSRATATLETETEFSRDPRATREKVLKQADDEKLYKGIHGYTDYKAGFRREQTVASEKAGGSHGPLRASPHIRMTAMLDHQPNICKDYKETGYCGYGDSCKFMHVRGDYKPGWQMEKEWDEAVIERKSKLASKGGDDDDDEKDDIKDDEDGLHMSKAFC